MPSRCFDPRRPPECSVLQTIPEEFPLSFSKEHDPSPSGVNHIIAAHDEAAKQLPAPLRVRRAHKGHEAMHHTHPRTHEIPPVMKFHTDMLNRVLDRHRVTQDQLALESQLSASHISRILSGERVVSPEVLRALWKLTRDPEVIASITGDALLVAITPAGPELSQPQADALAVRSCARVLHDHGTPPANAGEAIRRITEIDHAIGALAALRVRHAKLATGAPTPAPSGYRTITHQPHLIDQVA